MAGSMSAFLKYSLVHLTWKGLIWNQRRQCALPLYRCINPSISALHATCASRQVSNSSLPERYVPKKSSSEEVAGTGAGDGFHETRRSQPHDSQARRSRSDRSLKDSGQSDAGQSRSMPSSLGGKRGSISGVGGEFMLGMGLGPRKYRKEKLQQLPGEERFHVEGHSASEFPSTFDLMARKGVENHDAEVAAKDYCISLLALAPQPEAKLRMKMSKKNISLDVMDAVIADLKRCGLQSDKEYAEVFARSRWNGNAWGPKRIKFELLRRGLSKENVEAGLDHVFQGNESADEVDEEDDGPGRWGMNQKAAEQLISQARQRWSQGSEVDKHTRKRRMAGWLQRRGFSWDITSDLFRILERDDQEELEYQCTHLLAPHAQ